VKLAAVLLSLVWAAGAAALDLEAGASHERLTNNNADWNTLYVEGAHTFEPRQTLYGAAREVERFDLRDSQFEAGYYHPFTSRLVGQVEANGSPEHNFLASTSLFGGLAAQIGDGWVGSAGYRHNEYTTTSTRILSAGLERYFGSYRAFYTMNNGRPDGAGSATAHRIGIDHYYADERSRVGVSITRGREVENIVPNGIITSAVRAFNVYGRHSFSPDWALTWEVGTHEQGDFYRRTGARLGLRRHF
jgi:YaiO family outer membrane protein